MTPLRITLLALLAFVVLIAVAWSMSLLGVDVALDDEGAGHPVGDLDRRAPVHVRVVPEGAGLVRPAARVLVLVDVEAVLRGRAGGVTATALAAARRLVIAAALRCARSPRCPAPG